MNVASIDPRRALAEGVGTFFLVLIGPGAAAVNAHSGGAIGHAGVALAFAFVVMAMITALGHLSGAHINPAVTIAFWSVGRFPRREVAGYVAAQCAGAVAAGFALRAFVAASVTASATTPRIAVGGAFALEFLLSLVLMLVIMAVATDARVPAGFAALGVGLTVGFCAMMGGPLTGASMNPARSLGPAVAAGVWSAHWIYWIAPVTGTIAGAWLYDLLRPTGVPPMRDAGFRPPLGVQGPIDSA